MRDLSKAFGEAVRTLRAKRPMSQEEFAHLAKIDRTYATGIERARRNPSLKAIWRIADALVGDGGDGLPARGVVVVDSNCTQRGRIPLWPWLEVTLRQQLPCPTSRPQRNFSRLVLDFLREAIDAYRGPGSRGLFRHS